MPTLKYKISTLCLNCMQTAETEVPRSCVFVMADPNTKRGSHHLKYNSDKKIRKSCKNCGCDALILNPSALPEYLVESMGAINRHMGGAHVKS